MKNNLQTEAGPAKAGEHSKAHIDAINQVFALFKLNYHNQYFKAFSQASELNSARRLWLEMLNRFPSEALLKAAKTIIESSEYLPTLRTMILHCEEATHHQLPNAHEAYIEACRAPSPKARYTWSHLAVYYAGKASDWYFLQTSNEKTAFPVFKFNYQEICNKIYRGETLPTIRQPLLAEETATQIDKKLNKKKLSALKDFLDS